MSQAEQDLTPSSVRQRIQQWQEQGGGVVNLNDTLQCAEEHKLTHSSHSISAVSHRREEAPHEAVNQKGPWLTPDSRSEKRIHAEATARTSRPRSAPSKRVVSDGHWRNGGKINTQGTAQKQLEQQIRPSLEEPAVEPAVGLIDFSARLSQHERRERRKRRTQSALESKNHLDAAKGRSDWDASQISSDVGKENMIQKDSQTYPVPGPPRQSEGTTVGTEYEDVSPLVATSVIKAKKKLVTGKDSVLKRALSHRKKPVDEQPSDIHITQRVPSIQAWLENMPDPFCDNRLQVPKLIETEESTPSMGLDGQLHEYQDPNRIWEALKPGANDCKKHHRGSKRHVVDGASSSPHQPGLSERRAPGTIRRSSVQDAEIQKPSGPSSATSEATPRSLKRRQARRSIHSPMTRISTAQRSASSVHPSHTGKSELTGQDESPSLASPIISRDRNRSRKHSHQIPLDPSLPGVQQQSFTADGPKEILHKSESAPSAAAQSPPMEAKETSTQIEIDSRSSLKRRRSRLTKHSDLISVLSMPRQASRRERSTRSRRNPPQNAGLASEHDIMLDLENTEIRYMREVNTLIDGVVPVLLTCVLSKAESALAAGLFRSSGHAPYDLNVTRPIVDMGIALERLRSLHRRLPLKDAKLFLTWAYGAKKVYIEYLKAWRLGFQDVIVNLAPATQDALHAPEAQREDLPRDSEGNIVNPDGEKVDVAFLLKRPLVRLKYLTKTINMLKPLMVSTELTHLALDFENIVDTARARVEEERARLEDEAAANIDTSRSKDLSSLAPLNGVHIDETRRVRARDYFSCSLQHSNGQSLDCQAELILREEAVDPVQGGDLLICEVDGSGRWLLFPPISMSLVSARAGSVQTELVLMIRGSDDVGGQWQELLTLGQLEESTVTDWRKMIASEPAPPVFARSQSFIARADETLSFETCNNSVSSTKLSNKNLDPRLSRSATELALPVTASSDDQLKRQLQFNPTGVAAREQIALHYNARQQTQCQPTTQAENSTHALKDLSLLPSQQVKSFCEFKDNNHGPAGSTSDRLESSKRSSAFNLRRYNAKRQSRSVNDSTTSSYSQGHLSNAGSRDSSPDPYTETDRLRCRDESQQLGPEDSAHPRTKFEDQHTGADWQPAQSTDLDIERLKQGQSQNTAEHPSSLGRDQNGLNARTIVSDLRVRAAGSSHFTTPRISVSRGHSRALSMGNAHSDTQVISPSAPDSPKLARESVDARRSSSPLKRQYEPSIKSETSVPVSDVGDLVSSNGEVSSATDSSDEDNLEADDVPMPLMPPIFVRKSDSVGQKPPESLATEGSIKPSDSASQAPYKEVPAQPQQAARTVASLFTWSDKGSWDILHPDECSIIISPGLIEAFEMSAAHSGRPFVSDPEPRHGVTVSDDMSTSSLQNEEMQGERPIVALELTPLVPIRRGTALDISIRSPPTSKSQIKTSSNLMFRSRSAEECEILYAMINHARIHNPTYIALQNARGPFFEGATYANAISQRPKSQATGSRNSWFGGLGRSASYRAKSKRTTSVSPSQSSVGTMGTAFSALRRFGRSNKGGFNIALSTISSRPGGASDPGTYSLSDNSSAKDMAGPIAPGMVSNNDGSLGLRDAKIRLYLRENASRWRDLGSARMTILQPENDASGLRGDGQITHEKRILIHGKTKGEMLLDAQLGESSFERVARTGIAMSIWEDVLGPNGETGRAGAIGGVAAVKTKVYMIQLKSEAETAYTFSLVGKLRY